jgi:3-hydroxybutyryl-CoA dehydrogenase
MRINVIGSGYMGKQIAAFLSILGFDILLWQKKDDNFLNDLQKQVKKIERILKIKSQGSIKTVNELSKLENFITIETVFENLEIKKKIFNSLSFKENLFSNTSSIKLSSINENVNGLHFMNPITLKIIEVCKVGNFKKESLDFLLTVLKKNFYKILDVNDSPGYIINKIIFKDLSYFFYLLEIKKFKIGDIEKVFDENFNKINKNEIVLPKSDPIKLINIIGVDTCLQILINLNKIDKQYYVPKALIISVKKKILGYKNNTQFKIL